MQNYNLELHHASVQVKFFFKFLLFFSFLLIIRKINKNFFFNETATKEEIPWLQRYMNYNASVSTVGAIFLTNPWRTFPGPHSINFVVPSCTIA